MNLKNIRIGFENVEFVEIPKEFIEAYIIDGVKRKIINFHNTEKEYESCEKFLIEIKPDAFKIITSLFEETLFERVTKFQDIIDVDFLYEGRPIRTITMPWKGTDEVNQYQSWNVRNNGNLIIVIAPDDKAENYH